MSRKLRAIHYVVQEACETAEATLDKAVEFAGTFNKARGIFAEHKRRLHKHILATMETEDRALIEKLQLMA